MTTIIKEYNKTTKLYIEHFISTKLNMCVAILNYYGHGVKQVHLNSHFSIFSSIN